MKTAQDMKRVEVHILKKSDKGMASADYGIIAYAHLNFVNLCTQNLPYADSKKIAEVHQAAGFFTRSLKSSKAVISTEKTTSHRFSHKINKEEDNKKRKEEV